MFSINTGTITQTRKIKETDLIQNILVIDKTHLLIAHSKGLLKANQEKIVAKYYQNNDVRTLCHISGSVYLVDIFGFGKGLEVWNEQTD